LAAAEFCGEPQQMQMEILLPTAHKIAIIFFINDLIKPIPKLKIP
jgi:hypothetical protein